MNNGTYSPIVELRMYTLRKNRREELIDLFERQFIESREAVGIQVLGQFRDLDDPKRFTWLQGFNNMPGRAQSLNAFYTSPVWKAHRNAANATIVDSGNVLLLHPARQDSGFHLTSGTRPHPGSTATRHGFVSATIYYFDKPVSSDFVDYFEDTIRLVLAAAGASILAYFVTEDSPNTYPRLSIREGENVFIWFAGFADQAAHQKSAMLLAESRSWNEISSTLKHLIQGRPETMRLTPTPRSWLTGRT